MRNERFELGLTFVLKEEIGPFWETAGYVSAERARQIGDTGGETLAGIAREKNADWPGWAIVDQRKREPGFPKNLQLDLRQNAGLRELVGTRYRSNYWDLFRCDGLPPGLDLAMLDAAVQHQPKTAIMLVQRAVGAMPDGTLGPGTFGAAAHAAHDLALINYFTFRAGLYADLITADSRKAKFRDTWFGRLFRLQAYILTIQGGI